MKRLVVLAAVLGLLAWRARDASADPGVALAGVEVDSSFRITVVPPDDCQLPSRIGPIAVGERSSAADLLDWIADGNASCGSKPLRINWDDLKLPSKPLGMTSSVAVVAPDYRVFNDPVGRALWDAIRRRSESIECSFKAQKSLGAKIEEEACEFKTDVDGGLGFELPGSPLSGQITLALKFDGKPRTVVLPVSACQLEIESPGLLVPGAATQVIHVGVRDTNPACLDSLGRVKSMRIDGKDVVVEHVPVPLVFTSPRSVRLRLTTVPRDLTRGPNNRADLATATGVIGTVALRVSAPIEVQSPGEVRFDIEKIRGFQQADPKDPKADLPDLTASFEQASGLAAVAPDKELSIAVVDPTGKELVYNLASIRVDPAMSGEWLQLHEQLPQSTQQPDRSYCTPEKRTLQSYWMLDAPPDVKICRVTPTGSCIPLKKQEPLGSGLRRLAYVVGASSPHSLRVTASLVTSTVVSARCASYEPGKQGASTSDMTETYVGAQFELEVAASSRLESVSLPGRNYLATVCTDNRQNSVSSGSVYAIDDDALTKGACKIKPARFGKIRNGRRILTPDQNALLKLLGSQGLTVEVQRDGTKGATLSQTVGSIEKFELTIPVPVDDAEGRGPYRITARPAAKRRNDPVVYRNMDFATVDPDRREFAELQYEATLRPRGPFGFNQQKHGQRAYVTASTSITGIRTPAIPATLETSSDPASYQLVSPTLGLLAVVEPWDYQNAANPWPLNVAAAGGMNLFNFSNKDSTVSTLLGAICQLPVLQDDSGQLGASLAVGAFWENDLVGSNAFLVTLGVNIGSLFSPPTSR